MTDRIFQRVEGMGDELRCTYKLSEPIQFGSERISELHFRKPLVKDIRPMPVQVTTHDELLKLAARLCARSDAELDRLSAVDGAEVEVLVMSFLQSGPAIGVTPTP